jgi:hypothetical protein
MPALTLVSCSVYSPILEIEAICSSEMSVDSQRTTWRYIPEDSTLHNHRCEDLKTFMFRKYVGVMLIFPITVAMLSKALNVFARSNAGIVCSNPTQGMDVCVRLFCVCVVLCAGSGVATG